MNRAFWVIAFLATVGCSGDADKGSSGETGTTAGDDDDTSPQHDYTCCDWGVGLAYEYDGYASAEDWCTGASSPCEGYGFDCTFTQGQCAAGDVLECSLPGVTGADNVPVTAYYYSPDYDASSAGTACTGAGGTPQ